MAEIKQYSVQIVQSAVDDLLQAVQYVELELKQPLTATRIYQQLRDKIDSLQQTAGLAAPYFEYNGRTFYRTNMKRYAIIYTIEEETVTVIHVYHGLQDISSRLNDVMDVVESRTTELDAE
jgi:plasmid stabilization system protein ParE